MLYVQRDENGKITGLTITPGENTEEASLTDQDVSEFLTASDPDMIRVLEDLIQILISKNVINFEDLPETAQLKLLYRENTRSFLEHASDDNNSSE
ncbi:MAG: hypothetical protein KJO69_02450 [Gammaproteobacteria bacterium]|nr:hypothetical protein [Gammaproteobacteria bacterium]NNJ92114.1 hypothetical protein [Gammaproteobacteria bacterium]